MSLHLLTVAGYTPRDPTPFRPARQEIATFFSLTHPSSREHSPALCVPHHSCYMPATRGALSLFIKPTPAVLHLFVRESNGSVFTNVNDSLPALAGEANRRRWVGGVRRVVPVVGTYAPVIFFLCHSRTLH